MALNLCAGKIFQSRISFGTNLLQSVAQFHQLYACEVIKFVQSFAANLSEAYRLNTQTLKYVKKLIMGNTLVKYLRKYLAALQTTFVLNSS